MSLRILILTLFPLFAGEVAASGSTCLEVIVSNEGSGDIAVVDPRSAKVIAKIPVGKRPRGMSLSPDRERLFVALGGVGSPGGNSADGVGVVDLTQRQLMTVFKGISDPERMAMSRDGNRLFIASGEQGSVFMFDANSGKVLARTPVGAEAKGVDLSPGGVRVYATSQADNLITMLDTTSAARLSTIKVGQRPRSTAFSPDGLRAYVANEAGGSITVIDTASLRVLRDLALPAGSRPTRIAVPPQGSPLYISTSGRQILAIDARSGRLLKKTRTNAPLGDLAIEPRGIELYATQPASDELSVFALPELRLRARIQTGDAPWGVVCRDRWWIHDRIGSPDQY